VNLPIERPLSELYSADVTRLCRAESDAIIARHRFNFESNRLLAEAAKRRHKESLS
jgi:hypothetical protein